MTKLGGMWTRMDECKGGQREWEGGGGETGQ